MTEQDRKLAEELLSDTTYGCVYGVIEQEELIKAMQAYHEAKLKEATDKDIKMWSAKKVNEINEDLGYGDYLIIGAKAFRDGEIKIKL